MQDIKSAIAPGSNRAHASVLSMMMPPIVSVPMICASGSAFRSQGGTALCFVLAERSVGEEFFDLLDNGGI